VHAHAHRLEADGSNQDRRIAAMTEMVRIDEVGEWRLPDDQFLATFQLPQRGAGKLAALHPLPLEDRIHFDEASHTYTFDSKLVPRSVTGLLHQFASDFNPQAALAAMKASHRWEDKRAELEAQGLGVSDAEILTRWNFTGRVASARGTLLHFHAECMMNGVPVQPPHSPEFQQAQLIFDHATREMGLKPFRAEVCLYSRVLRCAGQADALFQDASGHIVLGDWKRVKALKDENRYAPLRYPLGHLDDCSWSLYTLQLNTYAWFLESECGLAVTTMLLFLVHPDRQAPEIVRVPFLRAEITALVDYEVEQGRASAT
jgi:hypothetical protein